MEACTNFFNTVHSKIDICCAQIENLDTPDSILYNCSERAGQFLETYLPENVAFVAKTALHSIHYIAMTVLLPTPLSLAAVGVISAYKISSEPSKNMENLLNGVAFGCLMNGIKSLLFLNVLSCIINIVAATILFSTSPLAQTLTERFSQKGAPPTEEIPAADPTKIPTDLTANQTVPPPAESS